MNIHHPTKLPLDSKKDARLTYIHVLLITFSVAILNALSVSMQHTRKLSKALPVEFDVPTPNSYSGQSSMSFALAEQQSFGFFTDILDSQWLKLQEIHARTFPNYFNDMLRYSNGPDDKNTDKLRNSNFWNAENFQVEFHCPMSQRVPPSSEADGPKWVCDPHRLRDKKDCLIYSFGSNGKAEFEHGMIDVLGEHHSCEIHTFDMVKWNRRKGDFAKALQGAATFHNWGLGTPEQAAAKPQTFKTLQQTMDELGHTNRTIDVFKIDCEWCEWFTFEQWLEQDIRQILVETHNAPMPNAKDFFQSLHDKGYVIFSKEANFQNAGGGVEFAFLRLSTDFFIDNSLYSKLQVG